jgi:predicted O-methyltransferase YrrM
LNFYSELTQELSVGLANSLDVPIEEVESELSNLPSFLTSSDRDPGMTNRWSATNELAAIDYVTIKLLEPDIVVETGVWGGVSSWTMLHAMNEIGKGRLISIDLPTPNTELLPEVGYLVPDNLRDRWELRIGPAGKLLPAVLDEVGAIDVFQHDSRHSYTNQLREYRTAWPYLSEGGLLISDDVSNDALHDACESWNQSPVIVHQSKSSPVGLVRK